MIYTGGGVILSNGSEQLTRLTRRLGFPITNTLMGLGAYPASDRQFLGMPGMHGTVEANLAMQHCDVLLAIGARFDDRVIGSPRTSRRSRARSSTSISIRRRFPSG
jgi:acetolactate synthase-1/2/3 large subunit